MSENDEAITLLREICDLQRAHLARYEEFTAAALARQAETQKNLIASSAQSREATEQYRLQTQQNLIDARSAASRTSAIVWISVLLQGALVFALLWIILILLRR